MLLALEVRLGGFLGAAQVFEYLARGQEVPLLLELPDLSFLLGLPKTGTEQGGEQALARDPDTRHPDPKAGRHLLVDEHQDYEPEAPEDQGVAEDDVHLLPAGLAPIIAAGRPR